MSPGLPAYTKRILEGKTVKTPSRRRNWTRDELIVAFNLYCRTPFGRIHNRNPEVIALSLALGRTPSALSWKLANFARLDPTLKVRNLSGASHGGKLEEEIWNEFSSDWNGLAFESELLRSRFLGTSASYEELENLPEGRSKLSSVMVRVNQGFFRATVLAAYENKCCMTGLTVLELLNASHIVPWNADPKLRTNPRNGLCLNVLHDRAFDRGLVSVDRDFKIIISSSLRRRSDATLDRLLMSSEGASLHLPHHFRPDPEFLEYHRVKIFRP